MMLTCNQPKLEITILSSKQKDLLMTESVVNIHKISILEVELIINNQLLEDGIISENQYYEFCKIIYEKLNQLKSQS